MKRHKVWLLATVGMLAAAGLARADTKDARIAFSNNYAGNSWRQAMLKNYDEISQKAVKDGVVAASDTFTTADKEVPTQAAQIQNLILQGYNAIVINAASPDALNGAVKQACDAGIVVVSFDGIVTEPCAYRIIVDYHDLGEKQIEYLAKRLPQGGNLLEIHGVAGTSIDDAFHTGMLEGIKKFPQFKIVNAVEGDWDETTAQKAVATVLPSLPKIDGVIDQGGDGYGAAQAFKNANRETPIIIMGNRQDELAWWVQQKKANGYETWSASSAPGMSSLAFWVAQQVLNGRKDIPHDLVDPYLQFTQDTVEAALPSVPVGGVATKSYSLEETQKILSDNMKK
jgi:ribose transport system substrate-binding protein